VPTEDDEVEAVQRPRVAPARADSSSSDGFERGVKHQRAEQVRTRARERVRQSRAVMHQAAIVISEDVARYEAEAQRILHLLAHQAYALTALERHKKELARIRRKLDAARQQLLKSRRRLADAERGIDEIPESELATVQQALEKLESCSTEWGRALAAVELAAKLGGGEGPRRMSMRGANKSKAMAFAEGTNPSTAIADLASSAHRLVEGRAPGPMRRGDGLGRSLDGLQSLERTIQGNGEESPEDE